MQIALYSYDGTVKQAHIAGTELIAPSVIAWNGKFFALKICSAALTVKVSNDTTLQYRQCRGEHLSSIELVTAGGEVENDL